MARIPALFRIYPKLQAKVPWIELGQFPTAVTRVSGSSAADAELWAKRDDRSGATYGGNKVRKLEFLLADARSKGARRISTMGAYGSHHVLATAIYGAQLGMRVDAAVFPQPLNSHAEEVLRAGIAANVELRPTTRLRLPIALLSQSRSSDHFVSPSSAVGALGYVEAALELLAQIEDGELPPPDVIYVPLGGCGTVAGLVVGLRGRLRTEIRAVRAVDRFVCNGLVLGRLIAQTQQLVGERASGPDEVRVTIDHRFFGGQYGRKTTAASEAIVQAADVGLTLEPTYTGKAMAALLSDARAGKLKGKQVLFWNTVSSVMPPRSDTPLPNWLRWK